MKKIVLLVVSLFAFVGVFSQTVTLSFTGRGRGGVVTEEIYQKIDSLQVRNISRHWEQMIYYPDTVVLLEALAVPMLDVKQSGLDQNVPNPFDCVTEANLRLYESDFVALKVVDANGREYAEYNGKLPAGEHLFEITLATPQAYFLTAVTSSGSYVVKMVNLGSCGTNRLALKSSSDISVSSKSVVANEFDLGDEMEYLAYTTYNNIVFDASEFRTHQNGSEDITIHFNIPYCDYYIGVDTRHGCEEYVFNGRTYYENTQAVGTLRLTSAGGCDSIVVVDVVIDHPTETENTITACQPIYWNGISCTNTGNYVAELFSVGGCDSIVTLHFTRAENITHHIYESDCSEITWNGETYTETGEYIQHFQSQYMCDSVVHLHFTRLSDDVVETVHACDQYTWHGHTYYGSNNTDTVHLINQHGCDSIVRLDLTLNRSGFHRVDMLVCGQLYINGHTYTSTGTYTETLDNPYTGCDSVVEFHLTVIHDTIHDIYESACDSFTFDGHTYTESNVYDLHYHPNNYCDSIVRLHLTVGHTTYSEQVVEACDSYTWFGQEYTQSGRYEHQIPWGNSEHCDSIVVLLLTIKNSKTAEKTIDACHQYLLDGERITETGTYYRTYTASNGCDSTVTYHINILDDVTNEITVYACGSYTWAGNVYTQTNDYVRRFDSYVGCDSTVTLHLFIGEPNSGIIDEQSACGSYTWEGTTYNSSGNYTKTLTNRYGCDSVVTLRLTINPIYTRTVSITACDSYEWEGDTYTESGTYPKTLHSVSGCDSLVTLNLTIKNSVEYEFWDTICGPYPWDGRTYTSSGDHEWVYTAANGCDSVVTLHLVYHELVTDARDGNTYCTMEYGDQVWMTSNMRYLPQVDNTKNTDEPRYYVYGYAPQGSNPAADLATALGKPNYITYGTLYNYVAAQTACPEGWHLPTRAEWEQLVAYLEQNGEYICGSNQSNVAKALASTEHWASSSTTCAVGNDRSQNNASGFNALPGGLLSSTLTQIEERYFSGLETEGDWWTHSDATSKPRVQITSGSANVTYATKAKHWGFSVRCVKDND